MVGRSAVNRDGPGSSPGAGANLKQVPLVQSYFLDKRPKGSAVSTPLIFERIMPC